MNYRILTDCIISFAIILLFMQELSGQVTGSTKIPKREVRAAWIATIAGLDWPRTTNTVEQQRMLLEIIEKLKQANFNTIFFQVRGRGDAMYKSNIEPWSDRLTGVFGREPGWDPLKFVIQHAHERGLEVHAWFNTFRVRNGEKFPEGNKNHIVDIRPEWAKRLDGETWMDPGIPEVREYTVKVAMDLVRNYHIDGIHFDFIRYPGRNYPDEQTYIKYGNFQQKGDWRRENVNKFVRAIYDSIMLIKPMMKVGSAPIGVYKNFPGINGWQSYTEIYQDSRRWLQEKKHDYIAPQVYWSLGNSRGDPDFALLTKDWGENSFGRHIYIGIGAYKEKVYEQLPLLIDITRLYNNSGNAFFRYENIKDNLFLGGRYHYPANIPPMPWKDNIPPNPPENLKISETKPGSYRLEWNSPKVANDGDAAKYYNIYRSTDYPVNIDDASNILSITSTNDTVFIDEFKKTESIRYYYTVTSFDKGHNESLPATETNVKIQTTKPIISEVILPRFDISYILMNSPKTIYLIYEIPIEGLVRLKIKDSNDQMQILVDRIQDGGKYVVAVNPEKFNKGVASIQISFNEETIFKTLFIH